MKKHSFERNGIRSDVYNMDCIEGMKQYEDNYFDLAVVDPPYGLGEKITTGGKWAAKYSGKDSKWDVSPNQRYFNELFRISKNQVVWGGNYFNLPPSRCFFIWDKVAHMPTLADCEYAWTSFDKNAKIFKHVRNTSEKRIHICQKPVKLYDWIFLNYAKPDFKILDTHLGSQSSRIAAYKNKLNFTAFETDIDYFNEGNTRFENHTKQITMF